MKKINIIILTLLFSICLKGQESPSKVSPSASEVAFISKTFAAISESDQLYRGPLSKGTLDIEILNKIDSVFDTEGVEEGIKYQRSLNLTMPESVKDSLWQLQHHIDFRNHLYLRGILERFGWISKDIVSENNFVQELLLMHPPKDWNLDDFLSEYSTFLMKEVKSGRMLPKVYANFYDNVLGKMMRLPQRYGTNMQFKDGKVLPPGIADLESANQARLEIGLPQLKEGEYRIVGSQDLVRSSGK